MRPTRLADIVGQDHLIGPGHALRRAIERRRTPSMILWGPPGSGKTTLARVIAQTVGATFNQLSAVSAGVAEIRRVVDTARRRRTDTADILFIDEIHRFNRGQQDALLPHVEDGTITLIGATTENPSFEVNSALLSRTRVFHLQSLSDADVAGVVQRALVDEERGLGKHKLILEAAAADFLVGQANGDARAALNALELASETILDASGPGGSIDLQTIADAFQRRAADYDKSGDQHYQLASALIKSIRGSDPHAAVYWLARMLEGGEDVMFVARRLVILAGEDVGLADPQALTVAVAAQQAAHTVGMPEAIFPLTEAALYLALAPKSNSVKRTYAAARTAVEQSRNDPVPLHLRNAATGLMRSEGYGAGYVYSHDVDANDPARWRQTYLPPNLQGTQLYVPGTDGFEEQVLAPRLRRQTELRAAPTDLPDAAG